MSTRAHLSFVYIMVSILLVLIPVLAHFKTTTLILFYSAAFLVLSILNFFAYLINLPLSKRMECSLKEHMITHYWKSHWARAYLFMLGVITVGFFIQLIHFFKISSY